MNGTHRNEGIWIAVGPGAQIREAPEHLARAAPWLAEAMGFSWTAQTGTGQQAVAYNNREEAMVAERMRALGYLE